MLRLLGLVFLVLICVYTAPWGLAVGGILCVGWLFTTPPSESNSRGARKFRKSTPVAEANHRLLNAIPLVHAVYCANCDSVTDSDHDACSNCGSRSIIAVSRLWQHTVTHVPASSARYKISFIADVRNIPAIGLNEAINLIASLAELGGDLEVFHIQVDPVEASDAPAVGQKIELVKPMTRPANERRRALRRAS